MDPGQEQQDNWKRLPATAGYWKALAICFVYCAALFLATTGIDMYLDGSDRPGWVEVAIVVVALGMPIFVLIRGAMLASRQIRRKTGYPSSPDGLILMLFATGISAGLISLPFEVSATYFVIVSLPFVVWVYLAILQRRFGPTSEVREQDRRVRSA